MARVMVAGALANKPRNGGNAWTRLQWLLGFRALGFDVHFVEQIEPGSRVDTSLSSSAPRDGADVAFFHDTMQRFGLTGTSCVLSSDGAVVHDPSGPELTDIADDTDLLFNIGGHLTVESIKRRIPRSIYLDDDPGYTQFWAKMDQMGSRLMGHDAYYTYGSNIGRPGCMIPTLGIDWRPTRPPVVLDQWGASEHPSFSGFTTVGSWRGAYGPVEWGGTTYGQKVHEFRRFVELPRRAGLPFEAALDIHPSETRDIDLLTAHGWTLKDPSIVAGTPDAYRGYIAGSGAEFSAAQGMYVQANSGWFSDRSACYLAAGKPVLVQDTGFSETLPRSDGLIAFQTLHDAAAAAQRINRDYTSHCRAARAIAERYFDAREVIGRIVEETGIAP